MLTRSKYTEEELNSGQLQYGKDVHTRENGKLVSSSFVPEGILNFRYKTIRESDFRLYQAIDGVIKKKVKTYYVPGIKNNHKVILNGDPEEKYDITSMDPDDEKRFLYLYLERVQK